MNVHLTSIFPMQVIPVGQNGELTEKNTSPEVKVKEKTLTHRGKKIPNVFGDLAINNAKAVLTPDDPFIPVHAKPGQIKTLALSLDRPDGYFPPDEMEYLQYNFLKALHIINPDVDYKVIDANAKKQSISMKALTQIGCKPRSKFFVSKTVSPWLEDNMLALSNTKGEILLLEPRGQYKDSDKVADIISNTSDKIHVKESNVYFEGGDLRYGISPTDGKRALFIGALSFMENTRMEARERLGLSKTAPDFNTKEPWEDYAKRLKEWNFPTITDEDYRKSTQGFLTEFSQYGYEKHNIYFVGANSEGKTFSSLENASFTLPEQLKETPIPMESMLYHSDLVIVPTEQKDKQGKPIILLSEPIEETFNDDSGYFTKKDFEEFYKKTPETYFSKIKQSYETTKNTLEKQGFSVRTLPFDYFEPPYLSEKNQGNTLAPQRRKMGYGLSWANYANIEISETNQGKKVIFIPTQDKNGESIYDTQALAIYKEVFPEALLVPVEGLRTIKHLGQDSFIPGYNGYLNCWFNVLDRKAP